MKWFIAALFCLLILSCSHSRKPVQLRLGGCDEQQYGPPPYTDQVKEKQYEPRNPCYQTGVNF